MPKRKLRIGVLFGGRSAEHEVSLVSAASVMRALDKRKYEVVPIGITKDGRWITGRQAHQLLTTGATIPARLRALLAPEPQGRGLVPLTPNSKLGTRNLKLDVIFPVLHGTYGEDGTVQGLLELTGLAYVGAGVLGSAVGMDKIAQKMIFESVKLPTPKFVAFTISDWRRNKSRVISQCLTYAKLPCFVKPANLGSSVGISKAHNRAELMKAIQLACGYDRRIIVEQSIERAMEIECAVLGNDRPRASVAGQIISSNEFYDYAKYVDGRSKAVIPARLPQAVMAKVRQLALIAFKALDIAGMARVDFLVQPKGWKIYLNEVNTIPGFTSISMYPKLWTASGLPYAKLLDELIRLAIERASTKARLRTSYRPKSTWYR